MSTLNDVFTSWRSPLPRTTRRLLIGVALAVLSGWTIASLVELPYADAAVVPVMALWILVVIRVNRAVHCILDRPEARLDERETELRQRAFTTAYRVVMALGALLLVPLMALVVAERFEIAGFALSVRDMLLVLSLYVALVMMMPFLVLAWRLPDPIGRDEAAPA